MKTCFVLVAAFVAVAATAAQKDHKFHAAPGPEPVIGHYVVTLADSITPHAARGSAEALALAYGGQLEIDASSDVRQFAIVMLPPRARTLSTDPRVREVVEIAQGDDALAPPQAPAATLSRHLVPAALDSSSSGTYLYDGSGNIKSIGTDSFSYDVNGRLKQATVQGNQQTFTYDPFGNRLTAPRATGAVGCVGGCDIPVAVNQQSNHVSGVTYDDAGNVTGANGATYSFDGTGMVTRALVGSDDRAFLYTADDERIAVRRGVSWTWSVRDLGGKVLREFTSLETSSSPLTLSSHTWTKDYVWRDGQLLASVFPTTQGTTTPTTTYHYHLDHLGTPRLVTKELGVLVGKHAYYAFGAEMDLTPKETATELMKFTGHERDMVAGDGNSVDYMHARYYNATVGRFLSVDPAMDLKKTIPNPQKWNRYSYVRNNPINAIDPDGKDDLFIGDDFTDPFPAARRNRATIDNGTASALISFIPGYGDAYDAISATRGRDLLTGDKIGTFARIAGVVLPFIGVGGLNKASEIFRGGSSMVAAAKDVKIIDGLVQATHGVSLNKVASEVGHFEGGAYRVTSLPDGLQIIQRGTKNANHLEIVPKNPMSMENYQKLLNEVKLEKVQ